LRDTGESGTTMKPKKPTQRFLAPLLMSWLLLPLAAPEVTVGYAAQVMEPTGSSISTAQPAADRGKVLVFDNALLDRVFANDRAAAKGEASKHDEAAATQPTERKPAPALLLPDDSFVAKITSRTPSTLAAALRFAEQGRKEINSRQYAKAINYFERAVSLGVRDYFPYIYYYLAQAHYYLANYQSAYHFLDVAESWLGEDSDWMTSITALRQQNINAVGYAQALSGSKSR
jgi:tetratricopeptide (TPR) repeat protein